MRVRYNSPVILSFSIFAFCLVLVDSTILPGITELAFTVYPEMGGHSFLAYFRLISHVIGHANWSHLIANLTLLLLIGPVLEEKYGPLSLLLMIFITALVTGIFNVLFLSTALLGSSGIVFMMILLISFTNIQAGEIPLTFILILLLYLAKEVFSIASDDTISQLAHIIGGICGSIFGFFHPHKRQEQWN